VLKIGLTGSIGSGKSEAGRRLAERGACVIDADRVAHGTYAPGSEGFAALVREFGGGIVEADGEIDRRRLAEIVFGDADRRRRLTEVVWPLTRRAVQDEMRRQEAAGTRVFVVEAALLVEAGWRDLVDQVWLVTAPADAVRKRLAGRGMAEGDIEARLAAATDEAAAAAVATVVLENDGDIALLRRRVDDAWEAHVAPGLRGSGA